MTHVCVGLRNMEKLESIFQSGKLEHAVKVGENQTKYWKNQGNSNKCYLLFWLIFKRAVYYLLKWIKYSVRKTKRLKNTGKWRNQGILSIRESENRVSKLPINVENLERYPVHLENLDKSWNLVICNKNAWKIVSNLEKRCGARIWLLFPVCGLEQ